MMRLTWVLELLVKVRQGINMGRSHDDGWSLLRDSSLGALTGVDPDKSLFVALGGSSGSRWSLWYAMSMKMNRAERSTT